MISRCIPYYILGDEDGVRVMISATRTTVVLGAGIGGFFLGGPMGAAASGVAAGIAWDGILSGAHILRRERLR